MVKKQKGTWPVCTECGGFYMKQTLSLGYFATPPEPRCSCPFVEEKRKPKLFECRTCLGFRAFKLVENEKVPGETCICPPDKKHLGSDPPRIPAIPSSPVRPSFEVAQSKDSSVPSISEQVELLTTLRGSGALTEQEFVTLVRRLMAGGNS